MSKGDQEDDKHDHEKPLIIETKLGKLLYIC